MIRVSLTRLRLARFDVRLVAGASLAARQEPSAASASEPDGLAANGVSASIGTVQDGSVIHTTAEHPTTIGSGCVIGHMVHLEGCTIEDGALVGNGSVVLHRARVCSGSIVGSNAVVTADTVVPPRAMALGVPAKIREEAVPDPSRIQEAAESYVKRAERYRTGLRAIG